MRSRPDGAPRARNRRGRATGSRLAFADERGDVLTRLRRALGSLTLAYEPIVSAERAVVAVHAHPRSREPLLTRWPAMAAAAEHVGCVHALGRAVRHVAADALRRSPEQQLVVDVHPSDLLDDRIVDAASPLARRARSVILELGGRAPLHSIADAKGRLDALKGLGFQVALEDLGGTRDGLNMLAELAPDVVDLDGDIVRGVHRERSKRAIVRCVAALCRDLGARVMACGEETNEDAAASVDAGCDLMRGPLFGAPVAPLEG